MNEHDGSKLHFPKELWQKCFALTPIVAERSEDFDHWTPPIPHFIYVCLTPVQHQSWSGSMCWTELHVLSILIRTPLLLMSNEEDIQREKGKMLISRSNRKNVCVCVCVCTRAHTHVCWGVQEGLIRYKLQDSYILFVNTRYLQWNHSANTHGSQKLAWDLIHSLGSYLFEEAQFM